MRFPLLLTLAACGGPDPCLCPSGIAGHGVRLDQGCACLPLLDPTPDPAFTTTVYVDADAGVGGDGSEGAPWATADWEAIDRALVNGAVRVVYDPTDTWPRPVEVRRTDTGPHRVVLDGGGGAQRARVPGVRTGFDPVPRHRVTVRGFEITDSRDKGIFWIGGDGVILEDNVVHDNRGTPAIALEYSSRSGFASDGFTVRNNHVYDQVGECLYIGGSEGMDEASHTGVRIENNLIHGCRHPFSSQHDGINVKDGLVDVQVRGNVVVDADWGIEVASAGVYEGNVVIDTERDGFHVVDGFAPLPDMVFTNNVVVGAGHEGFQLSADRGPTGLIEIVDLVVIGAARAGFAVGGSFDVNAFVTGARVVDTPVGFDGWGQGDVTIVDCAVADVEQHASGQLADLAPCAEAGPLDGSGPAGPDGVFHSGDEPWIR